MENLSTQCFKNALQTFHLIDALKASNSYVLDVEKLSHDTQTQRIFIDALSSSIFVALVANCSICRRSRDYNGVTFPFVELPMVFGSRNVLSTILKVLL